MYAADDEPATPITDTGSTRTTTNPVTESTKDTEISPMKKDDEEPTTETGKFFMKNLIIQYFLAALCHDSSDFQPLKLAVF